MKITLHPSSLNGTISAPPSKSVMQRACAIAWLRQGPTTLRHPGHALDDAAVLQFLRGAGCTITADAESFQLIIDRAPDRPCSVTSADFGESGLAARMFTPLLVLQAEEVRITGAGSLRHRPFDFFETVLPQLGVQVQSSNGRLPLTVKGPLRPADITIDGSMSSQFLTGLILAYTAAGAYDVTIRVNDLRSRPYIDLTLQVMQDMGMPVPEHDHYETFHFRQPWQPKPAAIRYTVEGDWSGAAFLLAAGAINGPLTVTGLDLFSAQGDRSVLQALMMTGAPLSIAVDGIEARPGPLQPFQFNAADSPDLFPPLAALAAYCRGTSVITGATRLRHKESDRSLTLQEELGKMGVPITLQDDLMIIAGGGPVRGAVVDARGDHRIAMACAVAALRAEGPTTITGAEAVAKSYPRFFHDLQSLGCQLLIH